MADKLVRYVVVARDGGEPFTFDSIEEAEESRAIWDENFPKMAPHRIIRLEETP